MICFSTWYFPKLASSSPITGLPVCRWDDGSFSRRLLISSSHSPLTDLHKFLNCFISQNTSDMQSFWCFIPDISKLLLGGEATRDSSTSHWLWLPEGPVLLLSFCLNFWLSGTSSTLCWLWCFSDHFGSLVSCKLNKGIGLKASGWKEVRREIRNCHWEDQYCDYWHSTFSYLGFFEIRHWSCVLSHYEPLGEVLDSASSISPMLSPAVVW